MPTHVQARDGVRRRRRLLQPRLPAEDAPAAEEVGISFGSYSFFSLYDDFFFPAGKRNEGLFGRLMELQSHAEEWGERGRKGGGGGGDRVSGDKSPFDDCQKRTNRLSH